ncbi:MAG TPA: hypothetical protein VGE12_06865 [Noviherbaspirillum sp.]
MHCFYRALSGTALLLPLLAEAASPGMPDAAFDPAVAGTPTVYQSAFAGYRPSQDPGEMTPDQWRALNDEVARVGGHVGAIKDEDGPQADRPAPNSPGGQTPRPAHHQH